MESAAVTPSRAGAVDSPVKIDFVVGALVALKGLNEQSD